MTITIEFLELKPEKIAKVTTTPGWFARTFRRRTTQVRYARTLMYGSFWVWDDTGHSVRGEHAHAIDDADYWQNVRPERLAFAEQQRRVNPDGSVRPPPSKC